MRFSEVQYYFCLRQHTHTHAVAIVSFYTAPDAKICSVSQDTLWVCQRAHAQDYRLINVKTIQSIVAMIPFPLSDVENNTPAIKSKYANSFYVAEKPFLPISHLSKPDLQNSAGQESDDDGGDDNDDNPTDSHSDAGSSNRSYSSAGESDGETGCEERESDGDEDQTML
jgi:U3 small nucleolar RNA-associated protein 14